MVIWMYLNPLKAGHRYTSVFVGFFFIIFHLIIISFICPAEFMSTFKCNYNKIYSMSPSSFVWFEGRRRETTSRLRQYLSHSRFLQTRYLWYVTLRDLHSACHYKVINQSTVATSADGMKSDTSHSLTLFRLFSLRNDKDANNWFVISTSYLQTIKHVFHRGPFF